MKSILYLSLIFTSLFFSPKSVAQNDPEFAKGFVMHLKFSNGVLTSFNSNPDLYVVNIQAVPQYTVIPHLLRAGVIAGAFYTNKKMQALAGPTLSVKLKTFNAGMFGSAANLHISADHLWGTSRQKLIGAGIHADLLNRVVLGLNIHRDYVLNTWWMQNSLGIRISKRKKTDEPFNQ